MVLPETEAARTSDWPNRTHYSLDISTRLLTMLLSLFKLIIRAEEPSKGYHSVQAVVLACNASNFAQIVGYGLHLPRSRLEPGVFNAHQGLLYDYALLGALRAN